MKILLTALNAKYIHSCPAVYFLKAYADRQNPEGPEVEVVEYTINDRYQDVLAGILSRRPDIIGFSVYIWNVDRVRRLIRDIRKVSGAEIQLWAGGPEATWYPEPLLKDGADLCLLGEGEKLFAELADRAGKRYREKTKAPAAETSMPADKTETWSSALKDPTLRGLAYLQNGKLVRTGITSPVDLDAIPFFYRDLPLFSHRILYYESSRGCPFSCSYCLSGKEHGIRFRSPELVEEELQFFLDHQVPQVKFIDRTFNADPAHAMRIWKYLRDHDNGITNFHFEIEGDRITPEELDLLTTLRPGLIQMEIGVQSANPETLRSIHRRAELDRIAEVMSVLTGTQNINLHLDLIAGLPYEGLASFRRSFAAVYEMRPHQLQLGFLKLLKGTELYERREEYGLVCSEDPPYEVLKTRWISFEELELLHRISDRVEEYVNTQGFRRSLPLAEKLFEGPFELFEALAAYYRENGYEQKQPSVFQRYDIFRDFLQDQVKNRDDISPEQLHELLETVRLDRFLHTHPSRRMTAEETFDLPGGKVRLLSDYKKTSPVHGEAEVRVL